MHPIAEESFYHAYWHDEAESIMVICVTQRWTWVQAAAHIARLNAFIRGHRRAVYTVLSLEVSAPFTPDTSLVTLFRDMIDEVENEHAFILCTQYQLPQMFLELAGRMFGLSHITSTYRYAPDLAAGVALAETLQRASGEHARIGGGR